MVETVSATPGILRFTPKIEDLMPNKQIKCPEQECPSVFKNPAHLQMHLERHHRKNLKPDPSEACNGHGIGDNYIALPRRYHCPVEECPYFDTGKGTSAKFFGCLKYVRQHYQKVHAVKTFQCDECGKTFATDGMRARHQQDCGRVYKCDECGWPYSCRETLLTHARRKGHAIDLQKTKSATAKRPASKSVIIGTQTTTPIQILVKLSTETQDQCIQTDPVEIKHQTRRKRTLDVTPKAVTIAPKKQKSTSTETSSAAFADDDHHLVESALSEPTRPENNLNRLNYVNNEEDVEDSIKTCLEQLVNSSGGLCDIETQTETYSSAILDQMLYSHMHTQTCDEFLSELGLADIQTQTNLSTCDKEENATIGDTVRQDTYNITSGPHDEMLVSTETQTSFTQCLLEYNEAAGTSSSNGITQHTQTCETLLEGLFGAQENDLIGSFQSAYTQT